MRIPSVKRPYVGILWLLLCGLLQVNCSCGGREEIPFTLTETLKDLVEVDEKGGIFCDVGKVCLHFPENAVSAKVALRGRLISTKERHTGAIGQSFKFELAQGAKINGTIKIEIYVDRSDIKRGLIVAYWDGVWKASDTTVGQEGLTRLGETTFLGEWSLVPEENCKQGICSPNQSSCPDEHTLCDTTCVRLQSDDDNCGSCGNQCKTGKSCRKGTCQDACDPSQTLCGNDCVDALSDDKHCGKCDNKCPSGKTCQAGECKEPCSRAEETRCDDACYNLNNNIKHCGKCSNACTANERCSQGNCVPLCGDKQAQCGDECVDLQTDRRHCGQCDATCDPGEICVDVAGASSGGGTSGPSNPGGASLSGGSALGPWALLMLLGLPFIRRRRVI